MLSSACFKRLSAVIIGSSFVLNCKPSQKNVSQAANFSSDDAGRVAALLVKKYDGFVQESAIPNYAVIDNVGWYNQVYPQFADYAAKIYGLPPLFPPSHPATTLTQGIVRRIHEALVAKIPAMRNVPEPQALVTQSRKINAFAFTTPTRKSDCKTFPKASTRGLLANGEKCRVNYCDGSSRYGAVNRALLAGRGAKPIAIFTLPRHYGPPKTVHPT
jgi:hypothetical protein